MLRHDIAIDMISLIDKNYDSYCVPSDIIINAEKQYICVLFRGTNCYNDWVHNAQFSKHNIKKRISVHKGFCKQMFENNQYVVLYSQLWRLMELHPTYDLYITGHSSGGALATLFGYLISLEIVDRPIQVVSFASPRIGNLAFKRDFGKRLNLKHWRITNQHDCIPRIPYFGFHHVGHKIYIKKQSYICCCKDYCNHMSNSYHKSLLDSEW